MYFISNDPVGDFDLLGNFSGTKGFVVLLSGIKNPHGIEHLFHHSDIGFLESMENINILRIGLGADSQRKTGKANIEEISKIINLSKRKSGYIRWGEAAKIKCACARESDIRNCIIAAPRPYQPLRCSNPPAQSCQTDVYYIITGCCLIGYRPSSLILHSPVYDYKLGKAKVNKCFSEKYFSMNIKNRILIGPTVIWKMCEAAVMEGYYD